MGDLNTDPRADVIIKLARGTIPSYLKDKHTRPHVKSNHLLHSIALSLGTSDSRYGSSSLDFLDGVPMTSRPPYSLCYHLLDVVQILNHPLHLLYSIPKNSSLRHPYSLSPHTCNRVLSCPHVILPSSGS